MTLLTEKPDNSWVERVCIRLATEPDLPSLEWDGEYTHFRRVYQEAYTRQELGMGLIWVCDHDGSGVIGQLLIQLVCNRPELADGDKRAYLYSFRIRPEYRQAGLGTRMLTVVQSDLIQRRFEILTLNVARDNPSAIRLYRRAGFEIVAEEPGIWSYQDEKGEIRQVNEPAWRMEKKLVPPVT